MKTFFSFLLCLLTIVNGTWAQPETVVQFGHIGATVNEMIISPDGTFMASTDGQLIKLWDLESGLEYRTIFEAGTSMRSVHSLAFTNDGRRILYTVDGEVKMKDIVSGEDTQTWSLKDKDELDSEEQSSEEALKKIKDENQYYGSVLSSDRSLLALGSSKKLELINTSTNKKVSEFKIRPREPGMMELLLGWQVPLAISPDNQLLLVDTTIYDLQTGKARYIYNTSVANFQVKRALFSPDGQRLLLGGYIAKDQSQNGFSGNWSMGDAFSAINEYYRSQIATGLFAILDAQTGQLLQQYETEPIYGMTLNQAGDRVAMIQENNRLNIYDLNMQLQRGIDLEKKQLGMLVGPFAQLPALLFAPDDRSLYLGGACQHNNAIAKYIVDTGSKERALGAAIPPIHLKPQVTIGDSIVLKEVEYVPSLFPTIMIEKDKGFRILDLLTGKSPTAYARYQNVVFSPDKSFYLLKEPGKAIVGYNTTLNEQMIELAESEGDFRNLLISPKGNKLLGIDNKTVVVWDLNTGELVNRLAGHEKVVNSYTVSNDEQWVCTMSADETVRFWSLPSGEQRYQKDPLASSGLLNTAQQAKATAEKVENIRKLKVPKFKNPFKRKKKKKKKKEEEAVVASMGGVTGTTGAALDGGIAITELLSIRNYANAEFSPDGRLVALWSNDYTSVHFYDPVENKIVKKIRDMGLVTKRKQLAMMDGNTFQEAQKNAGSDSVSVGQGNNLWITAMIVDMERNTRLQKLSALSPDWSRLARVPHRITGSKKKAISVERIQPQKGEKEDYKLADSEDYQEGLIFSPNGKMIAATSRAKNAIRIWDADSGEVLKTLQGHNGETRFGPNNKILISKGWDKQIKVWDIASEKVLYTFIGIKGENDYVLLLPTGHYTASRKNSQALAFRKGQKVYPFEQFDLLFNRPDQVLQTLENTSVIEKTGRVGQAALIEAYAKAYQRRLEILQIESAYFEADFSVPEVSLGELPFETNTADLSINWSATDEKYALANVNVYVNGVPIYGLEGKQLLDQAQKNHQGSAVVRLNHGKNNIQVRVINQNGIASLYDFAEVYYQAPPPTPTLHLVMLGTNTFVDTAYQKLNYPLKDLTKLDEFFQTPSPNYSERKIVQHRLEGTA
ncbi:MAG: WD40 repeat domain-containing protein, partial [Bacteroidota bacterium]